ncbi:MAG: thioredoxin family protein [Candidatus Nanopelagicales bacterium]|nr:thioredoxin family protein [Candidatus Nanopelagicales bacterium]MDZ4249048.1 thioredoxin family protein [Candidatus Nanopelagicales bacterium]
MTGLAVLVVALVAATVLGLWLRARGGRWRDVIPGPVADDEGPVAVETPDRSHHGGETLSSADLGQPLGEKATLVQFSSSFCQPCRATRLILSDVSKCLSGVSHVELDVESHMDLVRHLGVRRTPTVFLLDATGAIRKRASGQPRKPDIVAAIGEVV